MRDYGVSLGRLVIEAALAGAAVALAVRGASSLFDVQFSNAVAGGMAGGVAGAYAAVRARANGQRPTDKDEAGGA